MTEPTTPTTEPEEVTAGWLFMTANALGLSDADLAYVLDVRPDTIRKNWKYGTQPIPDGVRSDLEKFSNSRTRASRSSCPAPRPSMTPQ